MSRPTFSELVDMVIEDLCPYCFHGYLYKNNNDDLECDFCGTVIHKNIKEINKRKKEEEK